jgi:hypothetical protein
MTTLSEGIPQGFNDRGIAGAKVMEIQPWRHWALEQTQQMVAHQRELCVLQERSLWMRPAWGAWRLVRPVVLREQVSPLQA